MNVGDIELFDDKLNYALKVLTEWENGQIELIGKNNIERIHFKDDLWRFELKDGTLTEWSKRLTLNDILEVTE